MARLKNLVVLWVATLVLSAGLGGCSPYAYFNYPPQDRDLALSEPNLRLIAPIQAEALRALLRQWPQDEPFQLLLIEGTRPENYDRVIRMLGDAPAVAAPLGALPGYPSIEITRVDVRVHVAYVDMMMPADIQQPEGVRRRATATLRYQNFRGWQNQRLVVWPFDEPPITRLAPDLTQEELPVDPEADN